MSETGKEVVNLVMFFGFTSLLLLVACLLILARCLRQRDGARDFTCTGTFCGHCGRRLGSDPVTAIGLGSKGYFVYMCPHCQNETLLPTQSVE